MTELKLIMLIIIAITLIALVWTIILRIRKKRAEELIFKDFLIAATKLNAKIELEEMFFGGDYE